MRKPTLFLLSILLLLAAVKPSQAECAITQQQLSAGHQTAVSDTYVLRGVIGGPVIGPIENFNWYLLQGFWRQTDETTSDVAMSSSTYSLAISPPSPNPARSGSAIHFTVTGSGTDSQPVQIVIYDVSGRRIRNLVNGPLQAGPHEITWDGKNNKGYGVESGVYYCRYSSQGKTLVKSLVVLK
ncbi:MAG: FlgD immunoglobulin-like domain containing protein [bacterium]|nr:FlgD immunoglobulin-like domain containing protein [bacterium]